MGKLAAGMFVGCVWTFVFGPRLDRIGEVLRNEVAYGTEAVGVLVMAIWLDSTGDLTPLNLLSMMISAGLGMFVAKTYMGGKRCQRG